MREFWPFPSVQGALEIAVWLLVAAVVIRPETPTARAASLREGAADESW